MNNFSIPMLLLGVAVGYLVIPKLFLSKPAGASMGGVAFHMPSDSYKGDQMAKAVSRLLRA
jgi:hypothetical protein